MQKNFGRAVVLATVAAAALLSAGSAAAATANSSAYSLFVDLTVAPLGQPVATVGVGPVAAVNGATPPSYDANNTLASLNTTVGIVSTLPLNVTFGARTGILSNDASGSTDGAGFADGRSSTDALALSFTADPLIGPNVALGSIGADTITSFARVDGPLGVITRTGGSVIEDLQLGGTLGTALLGLGLNLGAVAGASANTVLLDALGVFVVVNEQTTSGNGFDSGGISVNALRFSFDAFSVAGLGVLNGDIIVGQSVANLALDIPPPPPPVSAAPMLALFGLGVLSLGLARRTRG